MTKIHRYINTFLLLCGSVGVSIAQTAEADGSYQLKFDNETSRDSIISCHSDFVFKRIIPEAADKTLEDQHKASGLHLWYLATPVRSRASKSSAGHLPEAKGIRSISPITYTDVKIPHQESDPSSVPDTDMLPCSRSAAYDDPLYGKQWHYSDPAYTNIDLERAWTLETGKPDVIVAVMDGFIDYNHPDLAQNLWVNEAELNGLPGVDDDGNGYIDDIHGLNFYDTETFTDHGTHIAGTIAAVNNNGEGVCGIAGGDGSGNGVRVMSVGITARTFVPDWQLFQGYVYAADNGAVISSNSWMDAKMPTELKVDGINYFIRNAGSFSGSPMKGGLVVFAAGNENSVIAPSPVSSPDIDRNGLLTVASVASSGVRSSYSNYGPWIDIAAPGGNNGMGIYSTFTNNRYGFMDGTSMACPHVSGVAALVLSKFGGDDMTPSRLRGILLDSSSAVDPKQAGFDYEGKMGKGILNACLALQPDSEVAPGTPSEIDAYQWQATVLSEILIEWTLPSDGNGNAPAYCEVCVDGYDNPIKRIKTSGYRPGERCTASISGDIIKNVERLRMRSVDLWGNRSEFSEAVNVRQEVDTHTLGNPYNTTHFTVFRPSQPNVLYTHPVSTLSFPIFIGSDDRISIEEPNGIVTKLSISDGTLSFRLEPLSDTPLGTYPMDIRIFSQSSPDETTTHRFTYTIERELRDNTGPEVTDKEKLNIRYSDVDEKIVINLNELFVEPLGLEFFIPDEEGEVPVLIDSRALYSVNDGILTVGFEITDDELMWLDMNPIEITVKAYNSYFVTSRTTFVFNYDENGGSSVGIINADAHSGVSEIYTLTGIRLDKKPAELPAGLYIIDGKKVLIK